MKVKPEIMTSCSILDSEDLIDTAYNGLVSCLSWFPTNADTSIPAEVFSGAKNQQRELDLFMWARTGVYIPGSKRNYWYGSFDVGVDDIPDYCCVYTDLYKNSSFEYTVVTKVKRFPMHVSCSCRGKDIFQRFKTTYVIMPGHGQFLDKNHPDPLVHISYFVIDKTGSVWTAVDTRKYRQWRVMDVYRRDVYNGSHLGPGALSLTADQKYLWLVKTSEPLEGLRGEAKVTFGLEETHIKSLFFARDLPLTEAGRKKPILHWVSAHQRRIRENIQIDIDKYLRGSEKLIMGNIEFEIYQPRKKAD